MSVVMNNDIEITISSEAFTYEQNFITCTVLHVYSLCAWSGQAATVTAV